MTASRPGRRELRATFPSKPAERADGEGDAVGELGRARRRRGDQQREDRRAAREPVQQAEADRAARVETRMRVRVRETMGVAVQMEVRNTVVGSAGCAGMRDRTRLV